MPKTTANLDNCFVFWKDNVGMSRQTFDMKSETESVSEEERPHCEFRCRVIRPNPAHVPAAMFFADSIQHSNILYFYQPVFGKDSTDGCVWIWRYQVLFDHGNNVIDADG